MGTSLRKVPAGTFAPCHSHAHFQPRIQREVDRHAIGLRIVCAAMNGDSRAEIILPRQPFSCPVGRAIQAVGSHLGSFLELQLAAKLFVREIASDSGW